MRRKATAVLPVQMGFGFEAMDAAGNRIPWLTTDEFADEIQRAPWTCTDLETTGLTPTSEPINLGLKDVKSGAWNLLRVRVLSVRYIGSDGMLVTRAYDLDKLSHAQKVRLATAVLSTVFVNHNAGFDLYWLRTYARIDPPLVIDTMRLARVMRPELPWELRRLAASAIEDGELASDEARAALSSVNGYASGWALDDVCLVVLGRLLDKGYQGPKNWVVEVLGDAHYRYATSDVINTSDLAMRLLGIQDPTKLLEAYRKACRAHPEIQVLIEPSTMRVVEMREHGLPFSQEAATAYVEMKRVRIAEQAKALIEVEPTLVPFEAALADPDAGTRSDLKKALGDAFMLRGVAVQMTEKTNEPQIGEKDLRGSRAEEIEAARPLFNAWVKLQKAKKVATMAYEWAQFAKRSADGRLHPLLSFGPVTERLSSQEPNAQQAPREQEFRNMVRAECGRKILSNDYGALDMRVGAALAIRAQREIATAYLMGTAQTEELLAAIVLGYECSLTAVGVANLKQRSDNAANAVERHMVNKPAPNADEYTRKSFWKKFRVLKDAALLARFSYRLAQCRFGARQRGEDEYSALRAAFQLGVDIHTFTALKFVGRDPVAEFEGLEGDAAKSKAKTLKDELGSTRQTGKVANLSLLYAMQAAGLLDTAARVYNIHWTLPEAQQVLSSWLDSYPEIDLWHMWTELAYKVAVDYLPDPDKGGRLASTKVYKVRTLGGRSVVAFGLNAALSYQDQSTGADIMALNFETFKVERPDIWDTAVNQIHDELLFHLPEEGANEATDYVMEVMNRCANQVLMPYGVPSDCSPELGDVWIKG